MQWFHCSEKTGFYEHEEPRKINWPKYTETQIKDAKETLEFIRDKVDECNYLKIGSKVGRKLTDAKILAKAILVCEFLDFTEREAEGWLDIMEQELKQVESKIMSQRKNQENL